MKHNATQPDPVSRLLTRRDLAQKFNKSEVTIWRLTKRADFPRAIRMSVKSIFWRESEVEQWLTKTAEEPPKRREDRAAVPA